MQAPLGDELVSFVQEGLMKNPGTISSEAQVYPGRPL